jgi:hypothetical protein
MTKKRMKHEMDDEYFIRRNGLGPTEETATDEYEKPFLPLMTWMRLKKFQLPLLEDLMLGNRLC